TRRLWSHIGSEYYDFLQHEEDAEQVRFLTKQSMIDFYRQYIDPASSSRAKVSIHMVARGKAENKDGAAGGAGDEFAAKGKRSETTGTTIEGKESTPVYIKNVPDFKARHIVTASPSPLKYLCYFEELASKLS
ncbi:Insulinase (Peptidase M16), partial [Ascosphaera aggregata]